MISFNSYKKKQIRKAVDKAFNSRFRFNRLYLLRRAERRIKKRFNYVVNDYRDYKYAMMLKEVCRKRKERRSILFSTGGAGGGKKVSPYRKYTEDSKIKC